MPSESNKDVRLSFTEKQKKKHVLLKAKLGKKSYLDLYDFLVDEYIRDTGLLEKSIFKRDTKGEIVVLEDE